MQVRKSTLVIATLALASAAAGVSAFASGDAGNDARIIPGARISLSQAVSAAEQHVGGTASKAEVEQHAGKAVYDVEVVKGPQVFDVKISPDQGTVIASTQDRFDHDDHDLQD
ncbi:MAG: PepSY domain-containing protein [Thiomonas sp.]|uniref:PepSY domain-containing protein n=1 Tax=Thiomonas sp. TaxID=2047785 RepID=UPI002A3675B6|nr:PepSY domain-containing protein [Thiomonas sp.]MDY0331511.1 PepSY domain-containing protein [Thiomonas sp.]